MLGSAWDDVFLSGRDGNKSFDGRAGQDEWRHAGDGAITVMLTTTTVGGFVQGPYVLKPGGDGPADLGRGRHRGRGGRRPLWFGGG